MSLPSNTTCPCRSRDNAADRVERRRLARAVAADQRDNFALLDRQRHAFQRLNCAVERERFRTSSIASRPCLDELARPRSYRDRPRSPSGRAAPAPACPPRFSGRSPSRSPDRRRSSPASCRARSGGWSALSSSRRRRMSCIISSVSCGFMPAVGSSSSSRFGSTGQRARDFQAALLPIRQVRRQLVAHARPARQTPAGRAPCASASRFLAPAGGECAGQQRVGCWTCAYSCPPAHSRSPSCR